MTPQALLDDAMSYLDRGISCIPVVSRNGSKKPAVKYGETFAKRLPTADELREGFGRPGVNGVAIISGEVSGRLATRDFDTPEGYRDFADSYPALAKSLPTVKTKRGFHVWCRSDLSRVVTLKDGEYRGAGISLAPRSQHHTGTRYQWVIPLPAKNDLEFVSHAVFTGQSVAETAECHFSAVSAVSAVSATSSPSEIVQATLPTTAHQRNEKVLALARGLKLNCGLGYADAVEHVRHWHTLALPFITTKHLSETIGDFEHAWDRVRHPLGMNVVDAAALQVDPSDLPDAALQYPQDDPMRRLIGLCAALAKINEGSRFFLSSHDVARRLDLEPMQAYRMLRVLVRDAVLDLAENGNERRATRYRWRGGEA